MYPYSATATIDAGVITTNVPNTQTAPVGSFDPAASIIVGTISGSAITFHHALAYLKITAPSDVANLIEITIESNGGVQLTGDAKFSTTDGTFTATGTPCKYVTIKPSTGTFTAGGIYYAAVIPGTYTGGLTVKYIYKDDANHKLIGKSKCNTNPLTLSAGTAKLLGAATSFDATYDVAVQLWADGPFWATTNIGADTSTDAGLYFAWGYTTGQTLDDKTSQFSTAFNEDNYPYRSQTKYADMATENWGTGWSVPTDDDFLNLINKDFEGEDKTETDKLTTIEYVTTGTVGIKVKGIGDYAQNYIFLPVAGYGEESNVQQGASYGYYWSNVQDENDNDYAYSLNFRPNNKDLNVSAEDKEKYRGSSVRPVRSSL